MTREGLSRITNVKGIILNGGENRVVDGAQICASEALLNAGVPVLSVDHDGSAPWTLRLWQPCSLKPLVNHKGRFLLCSLLCSLHGMNLQVIRRVIIFGLVI